MPALTLGEVSTDLLIPLIHATRHLDYNPAGILKRFGLSEETLKQPDQWISIPRYMRIGEALIDYSREPALGLLAGKLAGITGLGLAGQAALTAETLQDALTVITDYSLLYGRNVRGQPCFETASNRSTLRFYSIAPYNEYNRFVVDSILSSWLHLCQHLTGKPGLVAGIEIEFPAPMYFNRYIEYLGCPVHFGQPVNRLVLHPGADSTPLLLASPPDHQRLITLCEKQLAGLSEALTLQHQTARAIAALLPETCTLDRIADQLKLPAWTLSRKLKEEGSSFKTVLNKTRMDIATSSLQHTQLPVAEVAYLTGFHSTEAFSRAFKRWAGQTPGEYRQNYKPSS